MSLHRRQFKRPLDQRRYRKLYIIATEGSVTEPQYFSVFNDSNNTIKIKCLAEKGKSSPTQVLKRMNNYLKKESLRHTDEAWIVVDKDKWTDEQLSQLYEWSKLKLNFGFALSNPCFEYWLLLHFEEGSEITKSNDCYRRLEQYLPNYNKSINCSKITTDMILKAIKRAQQRDNPPCENWPHNIGTTVYRLVNNIINS